MSTSTAEEQLEYVPFHILLATYVFHGLVNLFHARLATLLIPGHHFEHLLIFLSVACWFLCVYLDFVGFKLNLVNLYCLRKERVSQSASMSFQQEMLLTIKPLMPPQVIPRTDSPMIMKCEY